MSTLAQSPSPSPDETFAAFWKVYPRRVGKAAALKSWRKLKPTGDLLDKIMQKAAALASRAAAGNFDDRKTGRRLQFCPHPATWLNAGRWDDEDDTAGGDCTGAAAMTREATDEDLRRLGL